MKTILTLLIIMCGVLSSKAQFITQSTSASSIGTFVPGYSEVTTINTKTFIYTPSTPASPPTPVDDDSTTEDNKLYDYADILPNTIAMSDGNITNTSAGLVWTVRISISNALNIPCRCWCSKRFCD